MYRLSFYTEVKLILPVGSLDPDFCIAVFYWPEHWTRHTVILQLQSKKKIIVSDAVRVIIKKFATSYLENNSEKKNRA